MHNVKGSQERFNDSLEQCDHPNKFIYPMSCLRRGIILSLYVMKECPSWLIQIYVISYSAEFLFEFMIKHLWRPIVKINPIWVSLSVTNIVLSFTAIVDVFCAMGFMKNIFGFVLTHYLFIRESFFGREGILFISFYRMKKKNLSNNKHK